MPIAHFSTDQVAPERRLHYWNECAAATFAGMTIDSASPAFSADLARWQAGDLTVARPRSQSSVVRRAGQTSGEERVIVHLQRRGTIRQHHSRHEQLLRPGDVSVCSTAIPLRLEGGAHELLVVQARRAPLQRRLPDLDDRLGRIASGAAPAARMLHDFVASLWREAAFQAPDGTWEEGIADVLYDLIALAIRGVGDTAVPGGGDDLARLTALVEARLGDPDLGGAALAADLGVSIRWVQQLFARAATTPRAYILRRRLERAAERLTAQPAFPITTLAFDLGFNDSAYFTRCFRRHYGICPSAWAARASR